MKIIDFIDITELNNKTEVERAKLLCFYQRMESNVQQFSLALLSEFMVQSGFSAPNTSRLRDKLTKGKNRALLPVKGAKKRI